MLDSAQSSNRALFRQRRVKLRTIHDSADSLGQSGVKLRTIQDSADSLGQSGVSILFSFMFFFMIYQIYIKVNKLLLIKGIDFHEKCCGSIKLNRDTGGPNRGTSVAYTGVALKCPYLVPL